MTASALLGAGWEDDSLEVLWRDADRAFCRLWRNDAETHAFILIPSGTEHPTLASINRLTHENELKDHLDDEWALRPVELVRERGRTMLVVEYTGGEPLIRLVGQPMEIGGFLRLAVALSAALGRLHGRGLIHKNINPANSLGVTLYQMVTGVLPFAAADPMELVHCHIARQAIPPVERTPGVPAVVSAIIMKLLAKTQEDRYQTAAGVDADLRRGLTAYQQAVNIEPFDPVTALSLAGAWIGSR